MQEEDIQSRVEPWLHSPFDETTQQQVKALLNNPEKLVDAFYTTLRFGTAGLRALMGVGTNRLNLYTIGAVTQGLADYIHLAGEGNRVAIAFDCRHHSKEFAYKAAAVLAANDIEVYLNDELRPTPFLSFIGRHYGCVASIMITASHNPPEYNGYKVYWSDGAQVVPPHDEGIIQYVNRIVDLSQVKTATLPCPLIHLLKKEDDLAYLKALDDLQNYPEITHKQGSQLHILYSNLHGTGITLLPSALSRWGFHQLDYVEKQKKPDGNFPTTKIPNPELKEALQLGLEQLENTKADLLLATDPDADRVGVCVLHHNKPYILNGNQIASLCLYHLLETYSKQKRLSPRHCVVSTIVTTPLLKKMCAAYGVHYFETLTGFKYIGEKIRQFEESPEEYEFLFGAEESYGFLYGTHARDKDAIVTSCLLAEAALLQKQKKQTLVDLLYTLYEKFGVYYEKQLSITLPDTEQSHKKIAQALQNLRENPPYDFLNLKLACLQDAKLSYEEDCQTREKKQLSLPKSDVLVYHVSDGSTYVIRPSGTEPKIKIYGMMHTLKKHAIDTTLQQLDTTLSAHLKTLHSRYLNL